MPITKKMNKEYYKEKIEMAVTKLLLQFDLFMENNETKESFRKKITVLENTVLSSFFNSHNSSEKNEPDKSPRKVKN